VLLLCLEAIYIFESQIISEESSRGLEGAWIELAGASYRVIEKFVDVASPAEESNAAKSAEIEAKKAALLIIRDAQGFFRTPTLRTAQGFFKTVHRSAPPTVQIFIGRVSRGLKSMRSNRKALPALQKISHRLLLMLLSAFGALPSADSYVCADPLTFEDLKKIFDYVCPTCRVHSSEALRKMVRRLPASAVPRVAGCSTV